MKDPSLDHPEIIRLFNYLQNNGIPIGIGTNSNNHTIFELYLPLISRPDGLVGPTIGLTQESRVGNFYFIEHDAVHHVVGIPGPRLSDLDDPQAAHQKLFEIMLLKEQVASTHSLMDYVRHYWNWRDGQRSGYERKEFLEANRGLFSMGNLSRAEYVEMFGHFVHGRTWEYAKFIWKHFSAKETQKARLAGVPLGGPDLYLFLGTQIESWLFKFLFPVIEPIYARYREVGYKGFKAYAEAMTNFMLQPWYVEWADRFKFGIPLDDLKKRSLDHLEMLRTGTPLGDENFINNLEFDRRFLGNEIALFGRRVAEMREMALRGHSHPEFAYSDDQILSGLFETAAELHDELKMVSETQLSESALEGYRERLRQLMSAAETSFPMDKFLPQEYREPHVDYSRYWRDITAIMVPRYGHNSGALSTTELTNFISARRLASKSFYHRIKWKFHDWLAHTQIGKPDIWQIENEMADDYERSQENAKAIEFKTEFQEGENVYIQRLDDLARAIEIQIEKVLIPQVGEVRSLSAVDRRMLYGALKASKTLSALGLNSLKVAYSYTLADPGASKASAKLFMSKERRLNIFVDRLYSILYKMALDIQMQKGSGKLLSQVAILEKMNAEFRDLTQPFESSVMEDLKAIVPNRLYRYPFMLDASIGLFRKSSESLIDGLKRAIMPFRFLRAKSAVPAKLTGWETKKAPQGPAHFVLALNHDQGLIEIALAYSVFEALGIDKVYTLTTKKAWERFPKGKMPGENVVYIEDGKPLDAIVNRIQKSQKERVGILVCPEGILPSMSASTPIAAKPGGFVLARKLARAFQNKIPVYFLSGIFNGHEHYTSHDVVPLELKLEEPVLVPTHEISKDDEWVNKTRLRFENLVNERRVIHQPDLINPRRASRTNFPVSGDLKTYVPISSWFKGSVFKTCSDALRKIKL